ncbi:MAG: hypothetical protein L6V86_10260 [Treponema sp.]|nr:MAG: hypothetical protein L6V86_10260 [Treponema sp.]
MNDKVSLKIPVIGIMKEVNLDAQKKFYDIGVLECFPSSTPPENLFAILSHTVKHISEEEKHVSSVHEQQKNTIKQLALLDKTGVYNKQAFIIKTHEMIKNNPGKQYYLMLVNLDRLKFLTTFLDLRQVTKFLKKSETI